MGYVHDTQIAQFIPPTICHFVTGAWTDAAGATANTIAKVKAAADETATVTIPIVIPSNAAALKGSKLVSIDIWWEVATAALDALSANIFLVTLPANGSAAAAPESQTFTYDTGHDTGAERITLDEHKMTLTITTPFWIDDDQYVSVGLSVNAAATSVFRLLGAVAHFTTRI
jgi:hypothetical protein